MATQLNSQPKLRTQSLVVLGFLTVQYVLGMFANLYVSFPENQSEKQNWEFANSQWVVVLHGIIGLLLLIGSIVLLVRSIRSRSRFWITTSSIGLVSVLVAAFSGSKFVSTQSDVFSMTMALGFIAAFVTYAFAAYKSK